MACFLGCFGSTKSPKRRRQRNKVLPRHQTNGSYNSAQPTTSPKQQNTEVPISPVSESSHKPEEQLSVSTRKRVTFDSNVKTYEGTSSHVITEYPPGINKNEKESKEEGKEGREEEELLAKRSLAHSPIEDDSATSSIETYPPNHRYQNCRNSDDESEELAFEDCDEEDEDEDEDEDDDDDDDDDGGGDDVDVDDYNYYDEVSSEFMESRGRVSVTRVVTEENEALKTLGSSKYARDRSGYVHSVLNPVENLTQWKSLKARTTPVLKQQKENVASSHHEPCILFSTEPSFKSKSDQSMKSNQEVAVDASLSNWLVSSEKTPPINKTSQEDRPILGALTVEEIKQFSASSSPRKSPSRSPDEIPIIGTVGSYWNHSSSSMESSSVSSYKGTPTRTNKYREVHVK